MLRFILSRARRVKCDGSRPTCNKCSRLGVSCRGCAPCWVWVEPNSPDAGALVGRSTIDCSSVSPTVARYILRADARAGLTWKDHGPLEGEVVDHLIEQVDKNQEDLIPAWMKKVQSPFAVFSAIQASPTRSLRSPEMPETSMERFLFHNNTTHVAKIMMPYDHPFNPWIQALVCRGSTDHALYDALLAHAAHNLSELYGKDGTMLYQATRYYDKAIQKVLARIESKASGLATTFASILTLVLVELYSGSSSRWRQHLQGAPTLLQTARRDMEGIKSVKTSVQSMHIIHIIGQTSKHFPVHSHKTFLGFGTVADTPDFGFTIGASKEVLQCISQITGLGHKIAGGEPIDHIMPELRSISGFLDDYRASQSKTDGRAENTPQHYQILAFVSTAKMYLHRVIFKAPPKSVQLLVSSTLEQVMKFRKVDSQNNFSIWPAFIAAVEAYTEQDIKEAEKWLDWSSTFWETGHQSRAWSEKCGSAEKRSLDASDSIRALFPWIGERSWMRWVTTSCWSDCHPSKHLRHVFSPSRLNKMSRRLDVD